MKNIIITLFTINLIAGNINAQEPFSKEHVLGISFLPTAVGAYNAQYGYIFDNGSKELNGSLYFHPPNSFGDFTTLGVGIVFRNYLCASFESFHFSPSIYYHHYKSSKSNFTADVIAPGVEGGYRWLWDSGFTINFDLALLYAVTSGEMDIGGYDSKDGD